MCATKIGSSDEKELLERCLTQDKKAWETFIDQYARLISHAIVQTLHKYAFSPVNEVTPDLFHTVFLSMIEDNCKKLRQFRGKCSLSSWLHLIAVRVTIDFLRKQSEPLSLNGETGPHGSPKEEIPNGDPLPDQMIELKDEKRLFEEIKQGLTAKERFFLELYYSRELPTARIAKILNTTENNVYQLKNRIREKMKKMAGRLL